MTYFKALYYFITEMCKCFLHSAHKDTHLNRKLLFKLSVSSTVFSDLDVLGKKLPRVTLEFQEEVNVLPGGKLVAFNF